MNLPFDVDARSYLLILKFKNMKDQKVIIANLEKLNIVNPYIFMHNAKIYINAIKERRMLCRVVRVSQSGLSRVINFYSCEKKQSLNNYCYRNYIQFMSSFGYKETKDGKGVRVCGGGMDMVFSTNYNIILKLHKIGFISKEECEELSQMTPIILY